jgi:hypothetical protein
MFAFIKSFFLWPEVPVVTEAAPIHGDTIKPPPVESPAVAFIPPPLGASINDARVQSVGPTIAITNMTSMLTDAEIAIAVSALQIQISRDFAPVWNMSANLMVVGKGAAAPLGSWVISLMDNSDQAQALGYHDLTIDGLPLGKVFVADDMKYQLSWTVTLSHETCELLVDPYVQNSVFVQTTNTTGILYPLEICDAVESDTQGYLINGTLVSNFVYPAWFESFRAPQSTKFDHTGIISAPLQLAQGGYIGTFIVGPNSLGWTQKVASGGPGARLARKGYYSRTNRRIRREQPFTN